MSLFSGNRLFRPTSTIVHPLNIPIMHSLNFSDLQDYIQHIPYNTNPVALCEQSNTNGDPAPLEAANTPLTGLSSIYHQPSRLRLDPEVLASIKRLIEEVEEEMGVNYLDLVKTPEASGADIYNSWISTSQTIPLVHSTSHSIQQSTPEEIEDSYDPRNGFEPPAATAAIPTQISTFPELLNSRNTASLSRRRGVETSISMSMPVMGQAGPSRWHQEERAYGEPIQPSIDRNVWLEHDMKGTSSYPEYTELPGSSTHNTLRDTIDVSSYHRNNGTNRSLELDMVPLQNTQNTNGDEMSTPPPPHVWGSADAAQYQGMFYDHAQPWFQPGEGSNTHHPSMSFSSEREKKETIKTGSIKDGREELRSRLTNEPVERQDIDKAQTNDGGCGECPAEGHGQKIGRDEIASRKRRRKDSDSEIESAGGPRQPRKSKVNESPDSIPGNISTAVQGSRGKPRNLNPRAPAMMRSYAHALTPLTMPEAKEGGFIALVTAGTKEASKAFGHHQMPVDMDSMTMV
uniref:Uncharacterized protein n=1 Tax=Psilocybe cubensis TaxID=181762 RepID=A0A8H7Y1P1_PSICU